MKNKNSMKGDYLKMKKTQKGITLIALIITVIVLLILAGVTINLTLGENRNFSSSRASGKKL